MQSLSNPRIGELRPGERIQLPTDRGRRIDVVHDGMAVRVRKSAEEGYSPTEIEMQRRQLQWLGERFPAHNQYPRVDLRKDGSFEMRYFAGGNLQERIRSLGRANSEQLVIAAFEALFRVSTSTRFASVRTSLVDAAARDFVANQARTRLSRLTLASSMSAPAIRVWTERTIAQSEVWISRITDSTVLPRAQLSIASHGDFVPTNVVFDGAHPVFIDVRAEWVGEAPYWDPILDLASFAVFHADIWPELESASLLPTTFGATFAMKDVLELANQSPSFEKWTSKDPTWRARLSIYSAIRMLGNVSNHLLTTRSGGTRSAELIAALLERRVDRLHDEISSLLSVPHEIRVRPDHVRRDMRPAPERQEEGYTK